MRDAPKGVPSGWPYRATPQQAPREALTTVVYRSTAVADMTPPALTALTSDARARNSREAITGLMLYDDGHFFQWLEGPPDNVDGLMHSIRRDPRHTGIEVLNNQSVQARRFGGWDMQLAAPSVATSAGGLDAIEPPRHLVEALRSRPEAAPSLLPQLIEDGAAPAETPLADATAGARLNRRAASLLHHVIVGAVIPRLLQAADAAEPPPPSARVAELADLLISEDQHAVLQLLREMRGNLVPAGKLTTILLEPAARSLGDLWTEDLCSEADLTLGLCRLQTAIRMLGPDTMGGRIPRLGQPVVLIVPEPGELHRLGAALDSSILEKAGWSPHSEYPENDRALQDMLSGSWFDVLDLSLSVALRREHWLPRVTQTIANARRASQNPALVVVVGGRVFLEDSGAGLGVGADATSKTSGTLDRSILKSMTPSPTPTPSAA